MHTPSRLMPHLALAVFTVLVVGAIVLSLTQAPPVARTQLRSAAANTAGASSVALRESISQVVGSHRTVLASVDERLQPPNRIEALQSTDDTLVIGPKVYVSPNSGKTWYRDAAAKVNIPHALALAQAPLQLLQTATAVTSSAGQTRYTFRTSPARVVSDLHLNLPSSPGAGAVLVTATVSGEFVTSFSADLTVSGQHLVIEEQYRRIDSLPTLVAPVVTGP